jgi:hypothetical protein
LTGPSTSEQWFNWQYKTEQHKTRGKAKTELEKILNIEQVSTNTLSYIVSNTNRENTIATRTNHDKNKNTLI